MHWEFNTNYYIGTHKTNKEEIEGQNCACFDLDGTLIKSISGRFSTDSNDWKMLFDNIDLKLNDLYKKGFKIVIITNQLGIGKGKQDSKEWIVKIEKIAKVLKVPFIIFASLNKDIYRKPLPSFWNEFINGVKSKSFYVGDACGREAKKKIKKDFADTDYKFALNIGIKFYSPEEFFVGSDERNKTIKYIDFNKIERNEMVFKPTCDIVLMMGFPGCGKSSLVKKCKDYVIINRDTEKTMKKVHKLAKNNISEGKKIVIDNTNMSYIEREVFYKIAHDFNKTLEVVYINIEQEVAYHNAKYRWFKSKGTVSDIGLVVYRVMNKKFDLPQEIKKGSYKDKKYNVTKLTKIKFSINKDVTKDYFNYYS